MKAAWPSPHDRKDYKDQLEQLRRLGVGELHAGRGHEHVHARPGSDGPGCRNADARHGRRRRPVTPRARGRRPRHGVTPSAGGASIAHWSLPLRRAGNPPGARVTTAFVRCSASARKPAAQRTALAPRLNAPPAARVSPCRLRPSRTRSARRTSSPARPPVERQPEPIEEPAPPPVFEPEPPRVEAPREERAASRRRAEEPPRGRGAREEPRSRRRARSPASKRRARSPASKRRARNRASRRRARNPASRRRARSRAVEPPPERPTRATSSPPGRDSSRPRRPRAATSRRASISTSRRSSTRRRSTPRSTRPRSATRTPASPRSSPAAAAPRPPPSTTCSTRRSSSLRPSSRCAPRRRAPRPCRRRDPAQAPRAQRAAPRPQDAAARERRPRHGQRPLGPPDLRRDRARDPPRPAVRRQRDLPAVPRGRGGQRRRHDPRELRRRPDRRRSSPRRASSTRPGSSSSAPRSDGSRGSLRPGKYTLQKGMSNDDAIAKLTAAPVANTPVADRRPDARRGPVAPRERARRRQVREGQRRVREGERLQGHAGADPRARRPQGHEDRRGLPVPGHVHAAGGLLRQRPGQAAARRVRGELQAGRHDLREAQEPQPLRRADHREPHRARGAAGEGAPTCLGGHLQPAQRGYAVGDRRDDALLDEQLDQARSSSPSSRRTSRTTHGSTEGCPRRRSATPAWRRSRPPPSRRRRSTSTTCARRTTTPASTRSPPRTREFEKDLARYNASRGDG